jgi:hypothetical protein
MKLYTRTMARLRWFNASSPALLVGNVYLRAWNVFNRVCADGNHYWGIGVLQIQRRHLFYIGDSAVSVLFMGQSK